MKKYHMIGIGGIGMSALAKLLLEQHCQVSGSDLKTSSITDSLKNMGAKITTTQQGEGVSDSIVIYSSSIGDENCEWQLAKQLNCPLLHRSSLLQQIASLKNELAVTGCHGKTTTTSLLITVLITANLDPSFAIGGILQSHNSNAHHGTGEYFVLEADESDGTFTNYTPKGAIITNIDFDHMDYWKTKENLIDGYDKFIQTVQNKHLCFVCGDDPLLKKYSNLCVTYGFGKNNQIIASNLSQKPGFLLFDIDFNGVIYQNIELKGSGEHLILNALPVFGMSLLLKIDESSIRKAFKEFSGVKRRVEKRFEREGILFIDDYAHHPKEIQTTIKGIKSAYPDKRLITIFQPHRYTRTKDCLSEFPNAFLESDLTILTEIYAASEEPIPGISTELILEKMTTPSLIIKREDLKNKLPSLLKENDLVLSMGAGDITYLADEMSKKKLGIVFGGRSAEHAISLRSAKGVYEAVDKNNYDITLFAILQNGHWIEGQIALDYLYGSSCQTPTEKIPAEIVNRLQKLDLIFPVLHGPFGEDGTLQGFFETLGVPYVGCHHTACAAAMDKVIAKQIFIANGFLTAPFLYFTKERFKKAEKELLNAIHKTLTYPLFIKPADLGSSIGVSRATNQEELIQAIQLSFNFSRKIIIENEILGRELEFAVFGNDEITVYPPGEILKGDRFYCYEGKYSSDSSSAIPTKVRADLDEKLEKELCKMVEKAYRAFDAQVFARFDCFLDKDNRLWFNELNPIPGFTSASLVPKIAEAQGISFSKLIDWLIYLSCQNVTKNPT